MSGGGGGILIILRQQLVNTYKLDSVQDALIEHFSTTQIERIHVICEKPVTEITEIEYKVLQRALVHIHDAESCR